MSHHCSKTSSPFAGVFALLRHVACLLVLAFAMPLHAQPATNKAFTEIQQKLRQRQHAEAIAQAEQVLAAADLSPADRARFLKIAGEAHLARGGTEALAAASACHERIITDATIANAAKVEALRNIADIQIAGLGGLELHQMDLAPAHATLERALVINGLSADDRAAALINIGNLHRREDKHAQARAAYEQVLQLKAGDRAIRNARQLIADTFAAEGDLDRAVAIYREHQFDLITFFEQRGRRELQHEECMRVLADESATEAARWNAFRRLPAWHPNSRDLTAIRQACDQHLAAFAQKDPARLLVLLPTFKKADVDLETAFVEWAAALLLGAPRLSDGDYNLILTGRINALALQGRSQEVADAAKAMAEDARVTPSNRLWADLIFSTQANGTPAVIEAAIRRHDGLAAKEKSEALLAAGRTALRSRQEPLARLLLDAHRALLVQTGRAEIVCAFVAEAPSDIGGWLASPLLKDARGKAALDRPYGDNISFLVETDSAMTGREAAAQSDTMDDDSRTDFHIACDREGLHLFFKAHDTQVAQVVTGTVRGGGFEMYLAPGNHQAYYTLLTTLPKGDFKPDMFLTSYPNRQHRTPTAESGTFRSQTRPIDNAIATYLFFAWETFYDKLPVTGTRWQFDAIRWTRAGGFSFGGSKSVHNRSSWGDIVFADMTDEHLAAIKRAIIPRAIAKYRQAKQVTRPVGNWADPDLGDVTFHEQVVAPLLKRLDEFVIRAGKGMTDDDVRDIFEHAVPGWMELDHHVAAARARYLEERLLAE